MDEKWTIDGFMKAIKSADKLQEQLSNGFRTRVSYSIQPKFHFYICVAVPNHIYDEFHKSGILWADEIEDKPGMIPNLFDDYRIRIIKSHQRIA